MIALKVFQPFSIVHKSPFTLYRKAFDAAVYSSFKIFSIIYGNFREILFCSQFSRASCLNLTGRKSRAGQLLMRNSRERSGPCPFMKRLNWKDIAIIVVVVLYYAPHFLGLGGSNAIRYHGESFKMSKSYGTFEDYKDDPNNLDTNELPRIEKAIVGLRFPETFTTREEFIHALFELKFPGYGLGTDGDATKTDDGSQLELDSVEIPQTMKNRYLVVRTSSTPLVLLDDFVSTNAITKVELKGGKLFYRDDQGKQVREHEVSGR